MWGKRTEEACFDKVLIKFSRSHRPLGVGLTDPSEPPHALAGVVTLSRARFQSERVRTLPACLFQPLQHLAALCGFWLDMCHGII